MDGSGTDAGKSYRVEKKGFENDEYDRRAMRTLIRTGASTRATRSPRDGGRRPRRLPAGAQVPVRAPQDRPLHATAGLPQAHRPARALPVRRHRPPPLRGVRARRRNSAARACGSAPTAAERRATSTRPRRHREPHRLLLDPRPGPRLSFASPSGNSSAVERHLAKVEVAGSIPVSRSNLRPTWESRSCADERCR